MLTEKEAFEYCEDTAKTKLLTEVGFWPPPARCRRLAEGLGWKFRLTKCKFPDHCFRVFDERNNLIDSDSDLGAIEKRLADKVRNKATA